MATSGKTILIVEDSNVQNKMLQCLFAAKGFIVEYATNGIEALGILHKARPDVILLDLMMPEMDGFELCERLKESEQSKETPIIILSSLKKDDHGEKLISMGASDFVEKPFNPADLVERVSKSLTFSVN